MNVGFSESEYARVRDWLVSALVTAPGPFDEAEMLDKLRSGEWLLVTTPNAGCVLQFFEQDGEKAANVLVIGGKIGGSLREVMVAFQAVCVALRQMNFTYLCGTPRPEFHKYLIKNGFERAGKELIKRL